MLDPDKAVSPSSNVELIDRLLSLSNRCAVGDSAALTELLGIYREDAEITPLREAAAQYDGSAEEAIRSYFERISKQCFVWFIYADQLQEHDDRVLALGGIRTVDRKTREDHETALALMYTVPDGKVAAVEAFSSFADARVALRAH
jgi:ketosteroid isomerase-like protein